MKKLTARERFEWTSALLLGLFCIRPGLAAIPLLLLVIQLVINIRRKEVRFQPPAGFIGLALLFFSYIVAIVLTEPTAHIGDEIVGKISLIAFPLLFAFRFREPLSLRPATIGLAAGTLIAFVMASVHSFQIYQQTHDFNNSFGSSSFSYVHHPSYLAAFFTIAWLLVLQGFRQKWPHFSLLFFSVYTLFFLAALLFCFSFAAILFFFLMAAVLVLNSLRKRVHTYLFWLSLIVIPAIPVVACLSNVHLRIEISNAVSSATSFIHNPAHVYEKAAGDPSGNNVRLLMWTVTLHEIGDRPFGYGTGGRKTATARILKSHNLHEISEKGYNPHNQFLQTAVETGIPGLLILLATLVSFVRQGIRERNAILIWIIANFAFNSLFESMLQRESGIVFYAFLLSYVAVSACMPGRSSTEEQKTKTETA